LGASVIMAVATYGVNQIFGHTLISIGVAMVSYFAVLFVFGGIRKEEISEMIGR